MTPSRDYLPPPAELPAGSLVWGYLRDSGGDGQEQSVPQQRAEIEAYCQRWGLVLVMVFADVAKSGGSVVGREQFNDMVDLTTDAELRPKGLLLWNFARFARDLDDSSYYKATIRRRGMVVHSLTDPIPDGQWGRVVELIIDVSNEEKRRQTSRDVKRALAAMVRQGFAPGGTPPRGYIAEQVIIGHKRDGRPRKVSRWVEDPKLWELVKLAWRMRAEGKTYGEIQRATGGRIYKARNCWPTFFRNRSYLGCIKAGGVEIADHHPAAVDQATWDAVQEIREAYPTYKRTGHPHAPRRVGAPSLLSGFAVCIECGSAMCYGVANSGPKKNYKWPYYICGRKNRHGAATCPSRRVAARAAERAILEAVASQVLTEEYAAALMEEIRVQLADSAALDREIEHTALKLAECNKAIANLLELAETFGARSAGDKLMQREAERLKLEADSRELQAKRAAAELDVTPAAMAMALAAWRGELAGGGEAPEDVRSRRHSLSRFVAKIELGYNVARVWYTYPFDSFTQNNESLVRGHYAILSKALFIQWE